MERMIVTLCGIGWLRPASGTWASAAAVLAGVAVYRLGGPFLLLAGVLVVIAGGLWAVRVHTAGMADKDRPEIVVDELAGQWVALLAPAFGFWAAGLPLDRFPWPGALAAFAFFRLFDIWKPWIIGKADRRGDAWGVMLDDLLAGAAAAICTIIAAGISHGLMR